MARFISPAGKWYPGKERFIDANAPDGTNPVYEGPDRDAKRMLDEAGVEYFGQDCRMQEETIIKARNLGCKDSEEYLKRFKNIDIDKAEQEQMHKLATEVFNANRGEVITPKPPVVSPSGGDDTSGQGQGRKGGFGMPKDIQDSQLNKRA